MKIALIGYGKMGQLIDEIVKKNSIHQVVARCSRQLGPMQEQKESILHADICIDFSHSESVLSHVRMCLEMGKPIVIGTTGWEHAIDDVKSWVDQFQGACLYAPNFSIGVHLFMRLAAQAAQLFNPFEEYDIGAVEAHHRKKADAPSGTAKALEKVLNHHFVRSQPVQFTSVRCGSIPGTHTLYFDSPVDTITVSHQARNREGFAKGALTAAEWLQNKKGFYTLDDMLNDLT